MKTISGTHVCESCGQSYDWIAREWKHNEIASFGRAENFNGKNIQYHDEKMIVGKCPHCGNPSMKNLSVS